ncbi:MAG TPA: hypothetical protein VK789_30765 [Bryobacteraceae bacterium]|jgi:Rod binding domain-containing protein|nr:hypothetical protein [Bryobacteraceae bacterium]
MAIDNISASAMFSAPDAATPGGNDPSKIHGAAQQFESLLIAQLLKSSREADGSGWMGTDGDDAGQVGVEMGEQQFATMLASSGGLGLARLVESGLKAESAKAENASS